MIFWVLFGVALVGAVGWWLVEKSRRVTHPVPPGYQPDLVFPHEQAFELYHNALSLCSMKTRLCLAELGIPYRSHHVDLIETGCYENIRPGLLAVNPAGTVPVLLHHGHPIYESHEQIRYAARHAPEGRRRSCPGIRDCGRRWRRGSTDRRSSAIPSRRPTGRRATRSRVRPCRSSAP